MRWPIIGKSGALMPFRNNSEIMVDKSAGFMDPEGLYQTGIQLVMPKYSMAMAVTFLRLISISGRSDWISKTARLMMRS